MHVRKYGDGYLAEYATVTAQGYTVEQAIINLMFLLDTDFNIN